MMRHSHTHKNSFRRGKVPAAKIEQYLAGLDYPATKQDVIEYAAEGKPTSDVLQALKSIADKLYSGPTELSREIGGTGALTSLAHAGPGIY